MAIFLKSKITKEYRLTDFIFDTDCKESFSKGNKVNFLDKRWSYVEFPNGIIPVKINGLYTVLEIKTSHRESNCSWRPMFPAVYSSMNIVASHIKESLFDDNKYITNWAVVTKPGSNLKGLLNISFYEREPILLDCEYDEIMPAENVDILYGGKTCDILTNQKPSFVYRKGGYYGVVVEGGRYILPPRYDLKSFMHRDPLNRCGGNPSVPYRVRLIGYGDAALVDRGDSLFVAGQNGKDMYIQGSPDKIPSYKEEKIARFEGEDYPSTSYIFGSKNDIAAFFLECFLPHRGTTTDFSPFKINNSDTLSTFLLNGLSGYSLYNARLCKDLITDANNLFLMSGTEGFISVTPKDADVPKTAFITRDYSELVMLNNINELASVAETVRMIGTTHILDYKGSIGLYDSATGFALPCSFDSIVPAKEVIDSIPELFSRFFFTYKNKRVGIVNGAVAVAKPAFDKVVCSADKRSIILKKDVYCYKHSDYELCITAEDDGSINIKDNLDAHLTNFITGYKNKGSLYISDGYFELAADLGDKEMLARTYNAAACIAINYAVSTNKKSDAMSALDLADSYHARAVKLSDNEIPDLDLTGIRERVTEYYRLQDIAKAEAEAARQKQIEEERMRQAEAAQRQRQQRTEAWAQLAGALSQLSQNINNAFNQSHHRSTRNTYSTVTTNRKTSSTSIHSSTSAPQRTTTKTTSYANRKQLELAYNTAKDIVMKYYYGNYTWDLNAVRRSQQSMRETRALANKQGFTIPKSDFEDVSAPYRK